MVNSKWLVVVSNVVNTGKIFWLRLESPLLLVNNAGGWVGMGIRLGEDLVLQEIFPKFEG